LPLTKLTDNPSFWGPPVGGLTRWFAYKELTMKRAAVFGNAGGGKSTLGRRLAELTGLPLYVVDMMQFRPGGAKVPHDEFLQVHTDLRAVTNGSLTASAIWRSPGNGSRPPIR
jgi:hypothetical protein